MCLVKWLGRAIIKDWPQAKLGASINNLVVRALTLALRSTKECAWVREREKLLSNSFKLNLTKLVLTA